MFIVHEQMLCEFVSKHSPTTIVATVPKTVLADMLRSLTRWEALETLWADCSKRFHTTSRPDFLPHRYHSKRSKRAGENAIIVSCAEFVAIVVTEKDCLSPLVFVRRLFGQLKLESNPHPLSVPNDIPIHVHNHHPPRWIVLNKAFKHLRPKCSILIGRLDSKLISKVPGSSQQLRSTLCICNLRFDIARCAGVNVQRHHQWFQRTISALPTQFL